MNLVIRMLRNQAKATLSYYEIHQTSKVKYHIFLNPFYILTFIVWHCAEHTVEKRKLQKHLKMFTDIEQRVHFAIFRYGIILFTTFCIGF